MSKPVFILGLDLERGVTGILARITHEEAGTMGDETFLANFNGTLPIEEQYGMEAIPYGSTVAAMAYIEQAQAEGSDWSYAIFVPSINREAA